MSKLTDPTEKKMVAYKEDHRVPAEHPHAFRHSFPRKKARASRIYRHQVRRYVEDNTERILQEEESSVPPVRRKSVRKWGSVPLGKWVAYRQAKRIRQVAWNYFRNPYERERDRERFSTFLAATMAIDTADTRALALHWHALLHGFEPGQPRVYMNDDRRSAWLKAFLADNPEWDQRLHAWMESADKADD